MSQIDTRGFTRETWPEEVLRQAIETVRTASDGTRHDALIEASVRVSDYVAAGDLNASRVEQELLAAAASVGLGGKRTREAVSCITWGLEKGNANTAWYPGSGQGPRIVRRFRWFDGRMFEIVDSRSGPSITLVPDGVDPDLPVAPAPAPKVRVTTFVNKRERKGRAELLSWDEMAEMVSDPLEWPEGPDAKSALPLWSWAEFEDDDRSPRPDGMTDDGSERERPCIVPFVHALALDYDDDPEFSMERVREWWGSIQYVAHTSSSHMLEKKQSPAHARGRVVLALSRPVTEAEFNRVATWVMGSGRGKVGEKELKNARRMYFMPARGPGGYEFDTNLNGAAIDVDKLFAEQDRVRDELKQPLEPETPVLETLDVTQKGVPKGTLRNLVQVLDLDTRWQGRLVHCSFSRRDLLDGAPLTDVSEVEIACWMSAVYHIDSGTDRVHQAASAVCARHEVHPVRSYLTDLTWDGEERLDAWLNYAGCEDRLVGDINLTSVYGRRWCIAAVARIYQPGCQVDSALILAGAKGLGKTSTLRSLAGLDWHAESAIAIGERDGYQQLDGVWIYELGELDSLRRSEVSAVKQFVTARVDRFRPPYGRNVVERKRQVVLAGTTNDAVFLPETDRRWWVVRVVAPADLQWVEDSRDQLWAEAVYRYMQGEQWHLTALEKAAQEADVANYRQSDPWEDLIADFLATRHLVSVKELLAGLFQIADKDMKKADEMRVSGILAALGWVKKKDRVGKSVWHRPPDSL